MSSPRERQAPPAGRTERLIGRIRGRRDGPLFVATAAVHGNEPAGVEACRRVLGELAKLEDQLRGDVVALVGNMRAYERGARFIDRDLNRAWTPARLERIRAERVRSSEDGEHADLLAALEFERARARGPIYFVDLHTSSADGCPFVTCGDTLRNRRFALGLPLPILLGLEEQLDGSLLEYMSDRGFITAGIEGGQHGKPSSVDHHEAALWVMLNEAGSLEADRVPRLAQHRRILEEASGGVPHVMEVRHRHAIQPEQGFRMEPGFRNFQSVTKGTLLATDRDGEVRAREDGLLLLPLYQGLGDDGFFFGRRVSRNWLTISSILRRLRLARLLHWLPGVRRRAGDPRTLVVDTRIARAFSLDVCHLLGFRKLRRHGDLLLVTRRRFDIG